MNPQPIRVGFIGYSGCGKDTAAIRLIQNGFMKVCFGDIIKQQVDALVLEHFGFSALTEKRKEKEQIRGLLEAWGDLNYEAITEEFFCDLPPLAVNTRVARPEEAQEWNRLGGILICIRRPFINPATSWEAESLQRLYSECRVQIHHIDNSHDELHLHDLVDATVLRMFPSYAHVLRVPRIPADEVLRRFMAE